MMKTVRFMLVAFLVFAFLTGAAQTAAADPTPCTVGCDGGNAPAR